MTLYGMRRVSSPTSSKRRPMKRLIEYTVFSGFVTACLLATCPTSRSPVFVMATTDGVVRAPSWLGMTTGSPPCITATTEFVVPRSIPIILLITALPPQAVCHAPAHLGWANSAQSSRSKLNTELTIQIERTFVKFCDSASKVLYFLVLAQRIFGQCRLGLGCNPSSEVGRFSLYRKGNGTDPSPLPIVYSLPVEPPSAASAFLLGISR